MYDTLINKLKEHYTNIGDKLALGFKSEKLTYSELYNKIQSVASKLYTMGIKKGDRVIFTALSKPEMAAVYLGIQYIGGIAVFADKNGTAQNIAAVYKQCDASLLLTDKPMKEYADGINIFSMREIYASDMDTSNIPEYTIPDENDAAELIFTTGSTGKAKGVILTYKAVYNILSNTIKGIGIKDNDKILIPLPLNHSFALRVFRAALYKSAMVVLQNGFTFAKEIENNITAYDCTALAAVPASIETIKRQMQDKFVPILGKMRYIEVGSGALSIAQRKELTALLPNTTIYNTWGSSETGGAVFMNVSENASDPEKIGALGKPIDGVEIKVLDPDGKPIVSDKAHPGRMALKGDMQMAGYWGEEELTKQTLRNGWLLTGDMVYIQDGYVYMLGRADDIINVGGEKVSPIEVENIAGQYDSVRECACIGVPDTEGILGQVPVLFVTVKGSQFSEDELHKFLSVKMERYKLPQKYIVINELPRNRMQKIDRRKLHEMWDNQDSIGLMNPVMQAIFARRSIRRFTDQPIPNTVLDMILKAGYYAPSGHNMQSWRFTVVESEKNISRLRNAMETTAKANNVYFYGFENPKVIVIISNDSRNDNGCQDASCAAENMFLAAQSYGIGSVWLNSLMKLRNEEPAKSLLDEFGIPEGHIVWCCAAFGYPVAEGSVLAKKKDVIRFIDR